MAQQPSNLLFLSVEAGQNVTIPEGFLFASIYPYSGASYTITNSLGGGIAGTSLRTSPSIDTVFSFPQAPNLAGWKAHVIAATGGSVLIAYANGN